MKTVITVTALVVLLTSCTLPLAIAGKEIDRAQEACERHGGLLQLKVEVRMEAECVDGTDIILTRQTFIKPGENG